MIEFGKDLVVDHQTPLPGDSQQGDLSLGLFPPCWTWEEFSGQQRPVFFLAFHYLLDSLIGG